MPQRVRAVRPESLFHPRQGKLGPSLLPHTQFPAILRASHPPPFPSETPITPFRLFHHTPVSHPLLFICPLSALHPCSIQEGFCSYLSFRALISLQLQVLLETQSPSFWLLQVSVLEYPSGPISQSTMSPFTHMSPAQNFKCDFSLKMVDFLLYCDLTLVSDAP